jgi:hypothetical protein
MSQIIKVTVSHISEVTKNGNRILTLREDNQTVATPFGNKVRKRTYLAAVLDDDKVPELNSVHEIDLSLFIQSEHVNKDNDLRSTWLHV